MTQLQALVYADWRSARTDARRILRSPRRTTLWLCYAAVLALFFAARVLARGQARAAPTIITSADNFVCALFLFFVFSLATGRGALGIFRSPVEARFIIGSPVAAPLAIAYLQLREALGQGLRFLFSLLYFIFVFAPREVGLMTAALDVVLVTGIIAAAAAVLVPRRLLSFRAGRLCLLAGILLGLLGLAPVVRDAVIGLSAPVWIATPVLAIVPAWHPGHALLEPRLWYVAPVVALAATGVGMLAAAGRDAYPELYALSLARIERRERRRNRLRRSERRGQTRLEERPAGRGGLAAPPGVWVFVWKAVVEFGRVVRPAAIAGIAAASIAAGVLIGHFARGRDGERFTTLSIVALNLLLLTGFAAPGALAAELRRPLFWLPAAPLFERLAALALAQMWGTLTTLELVALGLALGGGSTLQTLTCAIGFPALVALWASVGFATFVFFPSAADGRVPVAALRFLLALPAIVPPLVLDAFGTIGLGTPVPALLAASFVALVEAGGLIGIAAWRLDGHLDRLQS